jgi:hypothetical protein
MSYPVSLCGNLASPQQEHWAWQTAYFEYDLTEIDPAVARQFAELDIDHEGLAIGRDSDLLVATLHHGRVGRCERIDYADQEVIADEEFDLYPTSSTYTVCGWFEDNGQCFSGLWTGRGPRMAYSAAFGHYEQHGRLLMVSNVHEGIVLRAPESPVWADVNCHSEVAMRQRLTELIPGRV